MGARADARPRVLMVVPSPAVRGGGDVWLLDLIEATPTGRVDLLVVFETDGELVAAVRQAGHRAAVLTAEPRPDISLLAMAVRLAPILRRERPDATVHWSPRAQIYGRLAQLLTLRRPPTAWVQHVMPSRFRLHWLASHLRSDMVLCVSDGVAARQGDLYPQTHPVVIHPGRSAPAGARDLGAMPPAEALPDDMPVVACVGRVEPWKGQDVLVDAAALLRDEGLEIHVLLIGAEASAAWPEFAGIVRAQVDCLHLTDRVTFVGHVAKPAALVAASRMLVCASREEGFGLAIVEAMALGVPVAAMRCGGPDSFLTDNVDALLVEQGSPRALADAIGQLATDPHLAARLASEASNAYLARFTAEHTAARFHAVLSRLTDQSAASPSSVESASS